MPPDGPAVLTAEAEAVHLGRPEHRPADAHVLDVDLPFLLRFREAAPGTGLWVAARHRGGKGLIGFKALPLAVNDVECDHPRMDYIGKTTTGTDLYACPTCGDVFTPTGEGVHAVLPVGKGSPTS